MKDEKVCVFCGQKPGLFQDDSVYCAATWQPACKACKNQMKSLDEAEVCRRALIHGIAVNSERIKNRIRFLTEAEEHRPVCLRCGGKLFFMKVQQLDNSPYRDSIMKEPFRVLPAYCGSCGKFEFYHPEIVRKNQYLVCLSNKDTQE